ncbi:MAG: hypothetical protein ACRC80_05255 [Waterburya sp.]
MKILDYFEHPSLGIIISTTNPEFDNLSNEEIKELIGDEIIIWDKDSSSRKSVKVSSIDIATSLIGKKNLNLCLSNSISYSELKLNSSIQLMSEPIPSRP